jgi:hypothetical protein
MKKDLSVLEKDLNNELIESAEKTLKEINKFPSRILKLIKTHGGVETAKKLILEKNDVGSGFKKIAEKAIFESRKELFKLTLEYIVLKDKYEPLFHEEPELLKEAYERLKKYGGL